MNECGFGNKFGCNLDEIVKDPYKGRKAYIPMISRFDGVSQITVLSDYIPNKSIIFSSYTRFDKAREDFQAHFKSEKKSKSKDNIEDYIINNGNKYVGELIIKMDLTHIPPSADLNSYRGDHYSSFFY